MDYQIGSGLSKGAKRPVLTVVVWYSNAKLLCYSGFLSSFLSLCITILSRLRHNSNLSQWLFDIWLEYMGSVLISISVMPYRCFWLLYTCRCYVKGKYKMLRKILGRNFIFKTVDNRYSADLGQFCMPLLCTIQLVQRQRTTVWEYLAQNIFMLDSLLNVSSEGQWFDEI